MSKENWGVLGGLLLLSACGGSSQPPPEVDVRVSVSCGTSIYGHGRRLVNGDPMICRVFIENWGPDTANDVRVSLLSDPLASGVSVSCQPSAGVQCDALDSRSFRIPTLSPRSEGSASSPYVWLNYSARTPTGVVADLRLRATVSALGDLDQSNNAHEFSVSVTYADVGVRAATAPPLTLGQSEFITTTENKGPGTALMRQPLFVLPSGFQVVAVGSCVLSDGSYCPEAGGKYPDPAFRMGERVTWRWQLTGPATWREPVSVRVISPPEPNADPNPGDNETLLWASPPP